MKHDENNGVLRDGQIELKFKIQFWTIYFGWSLTLDMADISPYLLLLVLVLYYIIEYRGI